MSDPIADFIRRIRECQHEHLEKVEGKERVWVCPRCYLSFCFEPPGLYTSGSTHTLTVESVCAS